MTVRDLMTKIEESLRSLADGTKSIRELALKLDKAKALDKAGEHPIQEYLRIQGHPEAYYEARKYTVVMKDGKGKHLDLVVPYPPMVMQYVSALERGKAIQL